jgi:hypothetical protein
MLKSRANLFLYPPNFFPPVYAYAQDPSLSCENRPYSIDKVGKIVNIKFKLYNSVYSIFELE